MATATGEASTSSKSDSTMNASTAAQTDSAHLLEQANSVIKRNVAWSAGAGILPLPLFDLVAITGVQLKMISELCDVYGIPFSQSLARPIVISLFSSLGASMIAPVLAITT